MARRPRAAYELRAYRLGTGTSPRAMAALLGVSRTTVVRVEAGQVKPSLRLAAKIEHVTEGRVLPKDWVEDD